MPPVQWSVPWPNPGLPAQGYPQLRGVEHVELFHATPDTGAYCHHAHIAHHNAAFVVTWSNHRWDEDGPGQRVLYAVSRDGLNWSPWRECFPAIGEARHHGETGRVLTANGLVVAGDTLYAIAEVDDRFHERDAGLLAHVEEKCGRKIHRNRFGWGRLARTVEPDGALGPIFWLVPDPPDPIDGAEQFPTSDEDAVAGLSAAINAKTAHPLHMPAWDFRFHTAWITAEDGHGMCEPTVYRRPDRALVKLSRDLQGSKRVYACVGEDDGATWTAPVQTAIPDSPSKSVAGTLPDGRIYLVGSQVETGRRDPLTIALSRDGVTFDWAAAIRHGAPEIRHAGRAKGVGFQYPSAVVAGDALFVAHSIGKEDVAVTRVPLSALA